MFNSIRAKTFAAFILGLAAALTPMRQADAAMFVGAFDPAFGAAFPRLGFNGTATFEISDACLAQNGFCTTTPIDMLSATVTLYDLLNPASNDQLTFGFTSLLNVYTQGGRPFGVNSEIIGPQSGTVNDGNDGFIFSGSIFLQFQLQDFGETGVGVPSAFIFACPASSPQCSAGDAIQSNRAVLSFVPEPGSAALLLVALAAAAARLRRRVR